MKVTTSSALTNIEQGDDTKDSVFLLSMSEYIRYLANDGNSICQPTAYAIANGTMNTKEACNWWLRDISRVSNAFYDENVKYADAATVDIFGKNIIRSNVDCEINAVRPAMWVDMDLMQDLTPAVEK